MNHDLEYIATKLTVAVHAMAVSEAPLRQRIAEASVEFGPALLGNTSTPPHVTKALRQLHARLWGAEGVARTLGALSDREVRRLAQAICDAHTTVTTSERDSR